MLYRPLQRLVCLLDGTPAELARDPRALARATASLGPGQQRQPAGPGEGPISPRFLGLVPTRRCEMSCRYCDFGGGQAPGTLQPGVALEALQWFADLCARQKRQELAVEFFGGEPLAAPEVLNAVTLRTWALARTTGLQPALGMLTGGVGPVGLLELVADTFARVTLSVDGPPPIHDALRPLRQGIGSFEQVARAARTFRRGQVVLGLRVCVTSETVALMPQIAAFLTAEMNPDELSFEPLVAGARARRAGLTPPGPLAFVRGFLAAARQLESAGVEPVHDSASLQQLRVSFCPTADDGVILGPGGAVSACYLPGSQWRARGLELRYGRFCGGELVVDEPLLAAARALGLQGKERCVACFARWHCAGGCHVNHTYPGCAPGRDDLCLITRGIAFARLLQRLELHPEAEAFGRDPTDPEDLEVQLER